MSDKTVTIKSATDKELDALLIRLRKESELQSIIANIKRQARTKEEMLDERYNTYDVINVSTEAPIDTLYHVGVPGMKWGRKKGSSIMSRLKQRHAKNIEKQSSDYKTAQINRKAGFKNLSTQQLADLTRRLQLEQQLKQLNPTKIEKGYEYTKVALGVATTAASIYAMVNSQAGQAAIAGIKKIFNRTTAVV